MIMRVARKLIWPALISVLRLHKPTQKMELNNFACEHKKRKSLKTLIKR